MSTHGQYEGPNRFFWLKEGVFTTSYQTYLCHAEGCSVIFAAYGKREDTTYAF